MEPIAGGRDWSQFELSAKMPLPSIMLRNLLQLENFVNTGSEKTAYTVALYLSRNSALANTRPSQ
jgi:hypothetical protein